MTNPNFINRKLKYEITLGEYVDIANADNDVVEHIVSFRREFCLRCEKGADMDAFLRQNSRHEVLCI